MGKFKTHEKFIEEVKQYWSDQYTIIGKYERADSRVLIHCNVCNSDFNGLPASLTCKTRRQGCPACGILKNVKARSKTSGKYKEEIRNIWGNEYEIIGEYINNYTPILIKHNVCNSITKKIPNDLLDGHGCRKCGLRTSGEKQRHSFEFVRQTFLDRGYILLENEYKDNKVYMRYICPNHPDKKTKIRFNNLLRGEGCIFCSGKAMHTYEEVKKVFLEKNYTLIEKKYINANTPMEYTCNKHPGQIRTIRYSDLLNNHGCAECSDILNSKLSKSIESWLMSSNILFEKEYSFVGCRYKLPLRFDFYLPHHNICIEADGHQHFEPVKFGGIDKERANENFELTKKKDKVKDDYCKKKAINLIRIPYFDIDKVETILNNEIFKAS